MKLKALRYNSQIRMTVAGPAAGKQPSESEGKLYLKGP
jgi:hypothetical protein